MIFMFKKFVLNPFFGNKIFYFNNIISSLNNYQLDAILFLIF